jgi:hypothetical protein
MDERRKTVRLQGENEVTINIVSEEGNSSKGKFPCNNGRDISVSGAKIQGNILLPVDTIFKIDITLKNSQQKITTIGKVKWNKVLIEDTYYEAGMEFVDTPDEAIQNLYERERMLKEEWSKFQEINKYEIPPGEDSFIPLEEWSKPQEINRKEGGSVAKQIKNTIETAENNMKNCRYCSREIKSDAVKCEYCGRTLTERTAKKIFV